MESLDRLDWSGGLCFRSHGRRIGVRVNDPRVLDRLPVYLPPGWKPARGETVDRLYSLRCRGNGEAPAEHELYVGAELLTRAPEHDDLCLRLEQDVQHYVAEWARDHIFVHAGVVGWLGKAIVIPGRSFTGKTTLVAALVRAGATYYSDEFAVLDGHGCVHPFARQLSVRAGSSEVPGRYPAEALGGATGFTPLPVGLVVVTHFQANAAWRPRRLTPAQTVMALVENTVPIRRRPLSALSALKPVAAVATTLRGARGEATELATKLLSQMSI